MSTNLQICRHNTPVVREGVDSDRTLVSKRPLVKVCGVRSLQDAALAIECGANLIGLIFVESSRRQVDPTEAMLICNSLRGRARFVGVFQNATVSYINEIVAKLQLSDIQLHGDESPEYCRSVNGAVIKAFSVDKSSAANLTEPFEGAVSHFLFDRPKNRVAPEWRNELFDFLARRKSSATPFFVAGGLDEFNVCEVLQLLSPHAVDVASGIESRPGVKDPEKMRRFIEEVRNYD
ncbi:MAG: phosphoribosylanthranilate isomerase [Candidatus Obscuribacterales bacterium]|nr:phosphoribosylanthranilate isomerase [Candidatus Obscuribacterales bacterium]